jgi:uncharacterized repeat protein (TIGR03803 family)
MTKIRTPRRFTFAPAQSRKEGTMGKLGLAKIACIVFLFCATAGSSPAQTFTTLASFDSSNGALPYDSLVQGLNGNFYGTTYWGGVNCASDDGCGTVFEITPAGELTTLYSFCSQTNCTDGYHPYAGLVLATNGNFYGTTKFGGANYESYCQDLGCGTVYELSPKPKAGCPSGSNTGDGWCETVLYSFCTQTNCTDGYYPEAGLVQATNGNFYGTTYGGGANGYGSVFKITPAGELTTLYSFCSQFFPYCTDGENPAAGLVQAANGNFYGTTEFGGASAGSYGTVFQITSGGRLTTLYSFCSQTNCTDGFDPAAVLVQATNGDLYGTTAAGGANCVSDDGCGTVFEITLAGALTTLYSFCSQAGCADGEYPYAGLMLATNGNFYGTTLYGAANSSVTRSAGTVFEITPAGNLTTLYSFCSQGGCTDGESPQGGLVQATDGNFYGTTALGGADEDGVIFSLSVGLGPFVESEPTSGKVGKVVKILGTDLTGTTSVAFNGTAATFKVVSSTEITTTVPTGATTGTVEVTTPSGTLNTNVVFRVVP